MNIYVAAKTHNYRLARQIQKLCVVHNHTISYDWTKNVEEVGGAANERGVPPETQKRFATADMLGVYHCDLLIACGHPDLAGTFVEVGLAIAWSRPIWLFNWRMARQTVFQHLDNFVDLGNDMEKLSNRLAELDPRKIETRPVRISSTGSGLRFDFDR